MPNIARPSARRAATITLLAAAALLRGVGLPAASQGAGCIAVLVSLSLLTAPRNEKPIVSSPGNALFAGSRSAWAEDEDEEEEASTSPRTLASPVALVRSLLGVAALFMSTFVVPLLNAIRLAWFDMQVSSRRASGDADKFFVPRSQDVRRRRRVPWEGVSWEWVSPNMDPSEDDGDREFTDNEGLSEEEMQIRRLGDAAKGAAKTAKSTATHAANVLRGFLDGLG